MTKSEIEVLRNVIARLKCEPHANGEHREADCVRKALRGDAALALYLDSWVTPALEALLPESRNVKLAFDLSR